jgi:hypothetical protein
MKIVCTQIQADFDILVSVGMDALQEPVKTSYKTSFFPNGTSVDICNVYFEVTDDIANRFEASVI